MRKLYFLCGGGCNRFEVTDFVHYLDEEITVIELPGHGLEKETQLANLDDLVAWFGQKIDPESDIILIAHSMGANLAPYLATQIPAIKQLILLDGGYYDFDALMSLDDEIADTKSYFEQMNFDRLEDFVEMSRADAPYWSEHLEQAAQASVYLTRDGHYQLNMVEDTFLTLLGLQRACQGFLTQVICNTVLIPQTVDCPDWKTAMLEAIPAYITIDSQLFCGHSPHTECPEKLAKVVRTYLV
ncbi:alpha/beta fold hydrolase [Streptococcus caprae]|uniref:Alpha/beta fold hydrolase n=1 Tax=Streptococcus caprae TaxID=1640501 RepID=A0ABV8CY99_9STRE